jgi:cation diffusion facilitator CzcD-associated flavoprotein CzcO
VDDVVIVGAGPAGLAAAAALRTHGLDATILERGQHVGEQWRTRYDRLHLHTIRWLSNLPGYRIPRLGGTRSGSCNTWSSTRRTIASSHGSVSRPLGSTAMTAAGVSKHSRAATSDDP